MGSRSSRTTEVFTDELCRRLRDGKIDLAWELLRDEPERIVLIDVRHENETVLIRLLQAAYRLSLSPPAIKQSQIEIEYNRTEPIAVTCTRIAIELMEREKQLPLKDPRQYSNATSFLPRTPLLFWLLRVPVPLAGLDIAWLVARGADVHTTLDGDGMNALQYYIASCRDPHSPLISSETTLKYLIGLGLSINAVTPIRSGGRRYRYAGQGGRSLLHIAADAKQPILFTRLFEMGVDPFVLDEGGRNCFHALALARDNEMAIEALNSALSANLIKPEVCKLLLTPALITESMLDSANRPSGQKRTRQQSNSSPSFPSCATYPLNCQMTPIQLFQRFYPAAPLPHTSGIRTQHNTARLRL